MSEAEVGRVIRWAEVELGWRWQAGVVHEGLARGTTGHAPGCRGRRRQLGQGT